MIAIDNKIEQAMVRTYRIIIIIIITENTDIVFVVCIVKYFK